MSNYEKAMGATEDMTSAHLNYLDANEPGEPRTAYIDPDQFQDDELEAIVAAHPRFEEVTEHDDAVEMAKTLSNLIQASVTIQAWDGHKDDYETTQLGDETYFPNRMKSHE